MPRAKELVPFIEPIITKAKKGDLAGRRAVLSALDNQRATMVLVDQLAPQMGGRVSGHVRITRTRLRVGDNAQMAKVSFVDELDRERSGKKEEGSKSAATTKAKVSSVKSNSKVKSVRKASNIDSTPRKIAASDKHLSHKPTVSVRKSGER